MLLHGSSPLVRWSVVRGSGLFLLRRSTSVSVVLRLHYTASRHGRFQAQVSRQSPRGAFPKRPTPAGSCKIEDLVTPVVVAIPKDRDAVQTELGAKLEPLSISMVLDEFSRRASVRELALENGITERLFLESFRSFRSHCMQARPLDANLVVCFNDILEAGHSVELLFASFLDHARKVFPHLESMEELRSISDLRQPHTWYHDARAIHRKVFFHAGPTNSGKTYAALQRFYAAKSGIYCGPLKLLAHEVFAKTTAEQIPCDLITGDERRYAIDRNNPSSHVSSTVEMMSTTTRVQVGVIDEIQMLRDEQRGYAWTRALYGCAADEVHLCGEPAAVDIVRELLDPIGEHVEVIEYSRKSPLTLSDQALERLERVELEELGRVPAVIYGDLPPGTKLAQAAKFNDPEDPANVLVATDAIGMGMNLTIKRIIFHSLQRPPLNEQLPTHAALQISGRAGRFGSRYPDGTISTWNKSDLPILREILSQTVPPITRVGISPTYEQLETFSWHFPQATFVNLINMFVSISSITDTFFLCKVDEMKELAALIETVVLPLKVRYTFCTAPIDTQNAMLTMAFQKFARRFSSGQMLDRRWFEVQLAYPFQPVQRLVDLVALEQKYEVIDVYLWLSQRYPEMFVDEESVRAMQQEVDALIADGIDRITQIMSREAISQDARAVSAAKKNNAREQRAAEEAGEEQAKQSEKVSQLQEDSLPTKPVSPLQLPTKRKGKRLSVLHQLIASGTLSLRDAEKLKRELRGSGGEKRGSNDKR